jgi:hypothetical protein
MGRQLPSSLLLYEELGLGSSEETNAKSLWIWSTERFGVNNSNTIG